MINLRSYLRQNMMRFDALCFAKNEKIYLVFKYLSMQLNVNRKDYVEKSY